MSADHPRNDSRRRFLKGVVIGGAAAGVAAGGSAFAVEGATPAATPKAKKNAPHRGYSESEHIRRYYDLARG